MAKSTQRLRESKKAIALGVALLNINLFIFLGVPILHIPNEIIVSSINALLFLVGIYVGVQGGIDITQATKFDYQKKDDTYTENKYSKEEKILRLEEVRPKHIDELEID